MARTLTHIKPAPGRLIRDPDRRLQRMPEDGYAVDVSRSYWARKLRFGDVVIVRPERPKAEEAPKAPKAPKAEKPEKPEKAKGAK